MKEPDLTDAAKSIQLGSAVTSSSRIRLRIADETSEAVGWFRPGGFVDSLSGCNSGTNAVQSQAPCIACGV
jgi:hypothetical protein